MTEFPRPLAGRIVGLSISESDDSVMRGFPPWQVNRVTLQVVAALFGQGAGVVFGHDWREDGVMEAVHGFAQQMQPPNPISPSEAKDIKQPLLQNFLPWPDTPRLSQDDLAQLTSTLHVERAGLPSELVSHEEEARSSPGSPLYIYLRARGLTHLRRRLNGLCDARLCLGGRQGGSQGRYPGVIEEALLAVQQKKPLYLAGLLGGATRQIVDSLQGKPMPEDFCRHTRVNDIYADPRLSTIERDLLTLVDHEINPQSVWTTFRQLGFRGLTESNGLKEDENIELSQTPILDRVIQLVLVGLSRLHYMPI